MFGEQSRAGGWPAIESEHFVYVTPQQLRVPNVTEAFRGYHRTQVDLLLERAAATIERLTEQRPQPPVLGDLPGRADSGTIQRALILAQRAADDAIAEAEERAREIREESESKAQSLVSDAEASARQVHEDAERRLLAEVEALVAQRDRLEADVDALEKYASEYRARVWATIDADLAKIGVTIEAPSARPDSREDPAELAVGVR